MKRLVRLTFYTLFLSVLIFGNRFSYSQIVYEPTHRDVYDYLLRISQRGVIDFDNLIKPLPRKYIAEKLLELSDKMNELTSLEKEEHDFYMQDFYNEISLLQNKKSDTQHLSYVGKDFAGRYRLLSYSDDLFKVNVSPILGYRKARYDDDNQTHAWNGVYIYGYIGDNIGFSFDFRDNHESGNKLDKFRFFTPLPGFNARSNFNIIDYSETKIEYSEIRTTLSYNWKWGSLTAGKDVLTWGYEQGGHIVHSDKAPSYPFIRLDVSPVDWLRFNYFHGWLNSDVVDSSEIYYNPDGDQRIRFKDKFIASHTLTLTPFTGLDISIGESMIYSDKLEIAYLFPLMFFRLADHYLSRQINHAGDNAQFFGSVSSRNHIKNTHLYATLFIDEITIAGLFDPVKQRNQLGYSVGGSVTDLPLQNLTLQLEFTRLYPFVYKHFIQTTTYESSSYQLGHWMAHNADQVFASLNYRILRGLQAKVWTRFIRKGEDGKPEQQYTQPQPPFLFGLRRNYGYYGFELKYEPIHELFIKGYFESRKISLQQPDKSFMNFDVDEFSIALYYGL